MAKKKAKRSPNPAAVRGRAGKPEGSPAGTASAGGAPVSDDPMARVPVLHRILFGVLFLFMFALIGALAANYLTAIIFAGILGGAFYPLQKRLIARFSLSRSVVAPLLCLVIVLAVFLPCIYIFVRLAQEVVGVYRLVQSNETNALLQEFFFGQGYVAGLARQIHEFVFPDQPYSFASVQPMLLDFAKKISGSALSLLNSVVGNMFSFAFQFLIMILLIYSFFRYGTELKGFLLELSPLPNEDEELLIKRFNEMNYVTLVCNGLGGVIQGVLAGVAFAFAGIASPLLWTTVMVILAFIPLVGISFAYIPATIYLLAVGHYWSALLLFVWCTGVALWTENWFKPLFMGNRVQINSLLILFSIIGGMSAFGMAGIFYGPLIVFIFLTVADLYQRKYSGQARHRTAASG